MNNERFSGLSSPANSSLQQSLYIATLDRYLDIRGLISPVIDDSSGLDYDFFHAESGAVIKILKSLGHEITSRYEAGRHKNSIFIVDAVALEQDDCDDCGGTHPNLESEVLHTAATVLDAFLYLDDELYMFEPEGCEWDVVIPVERRRCFEALYNLEDE
jgi:hypothetical protein